MNNLPSDPYRNAPIWEFGMLVMTELGLMSDFDVKGFHDLFRPEFPNLEVAAGLDDLRPILPGQAQTTNLSFGHNPIRRYWFVSEDGSTVLQAQENLIGLNWRRQGFDPLTPPAYPGFEALAARFYKVMATVKKWHESHGTLMPPPSGVEMLYDNMIPWGRTDGTPLELSKALTFIAPSDPPIRKYGWRCTWYEELPPECGSDSSSFAVEASSLGLPTKSGPTPHPIIRIQLVSRASVTDWDSVERFFYVAHDLTRQRLHDLTTPELRAGWNA